jgi:hypothetical protein
MLPMVCLMIVVMTGPILLMLALAMEERVLERRAEGHRRALGAAEYGAWEWITRCGNGESAFRDASTFRFGAVDPWAAEPLEGVLDGVGYRVSARLLPDVDDADGDPGTTLVLHNRAFGFADSPFGAGGFPVVEVASSAVLGGARAAVRVTVADRPFVPPAVAAVAGAGGLSIRGPALIEGLPGEVASVSAGEVVADEGAELPHGTCPLTEETCRRLADPGALFGIGGEGWPDVTARRSPPDDGRFEGVVILDRSYRGGLTGSGVLVVHNPHFDPARFHASILRDRGEFTKEYDPGYSHLDPGHQPARLDPVGICDYTGVIVADAMAEGSATFRLRGQLFLLSREEQVLGQAGGVSIAFDRGAIREQARGRSDLLLGWQHIR